MTMRSSKKEREKRHRLSRSCSPFDSIEFRPCSSRCSVDITLVIAGRRQGEKGLTRASEKKTTKTTSPIEKKKRNRRSRTVSASLPAVDLSTPRSPAASSAACAGDTFSASGEDVRASRAARADILGLEEVRCCRKKRRKKFRLSRPRP